MRRKNADSGSANCTALSDGTGEIYFHLNIHKLFAMNNDNLKYEP